jgi:malate/lactate dehydrogenase
VERILELRLTDAERAALATSAEQVRETCHQLKLS